MQILNSTKEYRCECGKTFTNSQSFNGHKCHCKVHRLAKGGMESYENYLAQQAKSALVAQQARKESAKIKRDSELAIWLSSAPTCERCGQVMHEKFGSGRFCSAACSQAREHSKETKQKIRESLNQTLLSKQKAPVCSKKSCKVCNKPIKSYNKTGLCRYCLDHTDEGFKVKQELGKKGYTTAQEHGTHKGWQSRKITSYAEKFWKQVLDNNNISYEREFLIVCNSTHYFLDFRLERNGKLVDLEIDGKQHTYTDRAEADVIRDNNLQSLGYIIYRIPWNEINSDTGNALMKSKIDDFLDFYNSL